MVQMRRQGVYWLLTIPESAWVPCLPGGVLYVRGQKESGSDTGYLHWQVLAVFQRKTTLRQCKSTFGGDVVHAELSRSSAADTYVWKESTRVANTQFEFGTRPIRRNKSTDWDRIWELAQAGNLAEMPADIRFRSYRTIRTIRSDYARPDPMERIGYIFWGPTATGKSRRAWDEAGLQAYPKNPRTKWWDGYDGQEHVVIDEFRGAIDISYLLSWVDRYPVLAEVKGASVPLNVKKMWITSNLDPRLWYPDLDSDTLAALLRRFNITHFN